MFKKTILLFIIFFISTTSFAYAESPLEINSPAGILMDSATGKVIYEKNPHMQMYPASITKILTAILALEHGNLNDLITASPDAVLTLPAGSSNIGILPGETLSLEDLLFGLMVASGNETANIIAEYVSGSYDDFIKLMNNKLIELGANNTNFVNPNGLHDDNHFTCAYDMAVITKYAMEMPKFREIVATDYYEIPPTNKYNKIRYLSNTHHLINRYRANSNYNYYYKPAIGVKTGFTSKSQHTLVSAANKNEFELIAVVLGANVEGVKINSYEDTINLFEYGFNNYSIQTLVNTNDIVDEANVLHAKNNLKPLLLAETNLKSLLDKNIDKNLIEKETYVNENIKAPVEKGDILGKAIYKYKGEILGEINLISDKNIERDIFLVIISSLLFLLNTIIVKIFLSLLTIYLITGLIVKNSRKKKRLAYKRSNVHYINRYREIR